MNSINNIKEDAANLESLLRQYFLWGNDNDLLKQKTMNMTAETVFNTEIFQVPSSQKENEMLKMLHKNLQLRYYPFVWLWTILITIFLSSIIYYFYTSSPLKKVQKPLLEKLFLKENFTKPLVQNDGLKTSSFDLLSKRKKQPKKKNGLQVTNFKDKVEKNHPLEKKKLLKPESKILLPDSKQNYSASLSPAPDWALYGFKVNEVPGKYIKQIGHFEFDTIGTYIWVTKKSFNHEYYSGEPFKRTPDDMVFINWADTQRQYDIPVAARMYLNAQKTEIKGIYYYYTHDLPESAMSQLMIPFYFRKSEVTNMEYKNFLLWLIKQNGYSDMKQACSTDNDVKRAFSYTFFNPDNPGLKGLISSTINVYPDTIAFLRDFPWSKDMPQAHYYFSDHQYDAYPVCGVNYWQAMAYLDWLTESYQNYLNQNHIQYQVSFELPTDIEWELAANEEKPTRFRHPLRSLDFIMDNDWICNLRLSENMADWEVWKPLDNMLENNVEYDHNMIADGYLFQGPANLSHLTAVKSNPLHLAPSGISWMDGNVSEWMQETYELNWLPMFKLHQDYLRKNGGEDSVLLADVEMYFNKRNDLDGHLVRGGNFYDERYSSILSQNLAGIMTKRFVSPSKDFSTVGFRYVLRVVAKQ